MSSLPKPKRVKLSLSYEEEEEEEEDHEREHENEHPNDNDLERNYVSEKVKVTEEENRDGNPPSPKMEITEEKEMEKDKNKIQKNNEPSSSFLPLPLSLSHVFPPSSSVLIPFSSSSLLRDMRVLHSNLQSTFTQQEELSRSSEINIVYSYWNGNGNRRNITCEKGIHIDKFLELVIRQLLEVDTKEQQKDKSSHSTLTVSTDRHRVILRELRGLRSSDLLFVKEDLIIPPSITFYDLIVTESRGKSGPLFSFSVVDEIRLLSNAKEEKKDSHAAKVVTKSFYEKNKKNFPYSRWEIWDPKKQYDKYTIK